MARIDTTPLTGVYPVRVSPSGETDVYTEPLVVCAQRGPDGVLEAWIAARTSRRTSTGTRVTSAGAREEYVDLNSAEYVTPNAERRAATNGTTPVLLGRPATVSRTSNYGRQIAVLKRWSIIGLLHQTFRVEGFDAVKEGYTLDELEQALVRTYNQ